MDFIHILLNIFLPPTVLTALLLFLPTYFFFKLLLFSKRSLFTENIAGKVVIITGASSGIGEHLAYEYASRGAYLALVARRVKRLQEVAGRAEWLGSPDVIFIPADVSKAEDCRRFVHDTINHFGRLDHLVNNAGITSMSMFEDSAKITNFRPVMDVNFWGSVYGSYYALPYLKESRGKIIGIASSAAWLPVPRMSFYSASKAALISFYETLRVEVGREIGITIVTPGLIESEMTQGKFFSQEGRLELDQEMRDVQISLLPIGSVSNCAEAIVRSACRGDEYLTEPGWIRTTFYLNAFWPEILEWLNRFYLLTLVGTSQREALSKKVLDVSGLKDYVYPPLVRSLQI